MKKGNLKAVHDDDLIQLLESIGEYELVKSERANCYFCNSKVYIDDISAVFPVGEKVAYCCSEYRCYQLLLTR